MNAVGAFVGRVCALAPTPERADRGAIAALRRGTGRPVGEPIAAAAVFFRLAPPGGALEGGAWVAATMWARHPRHSMSAGSFGTSLARLSRTYEKASERLLRRLLSANGEELPGGLLRATGLLRQAAIDVDYIRLACDVTTWDNPEQSRRRDWARDYYYGSRPQEGDA